MIRVPTIVLAPGLLAALLLAGAAQAQGTRCTAFLHDRDGSWRSFVDDEMLLPRGPMPIHKGDRFPRGSFVARLLDAQCRPGGELY